MDGGAQRQVLDEARFHLQQLVEAGLEVSAGGVPGQAQEETEVARFRSGQASIEGAQLRVGQRLAEQPQPFLAARLDQRRDEQTVEQALRRGLPHLRLQPLRIGIARVAAEDEATLFEQTQHLPEMPCLLPRQPRHRPRQARHLRKRRQQGERVGRSLLLAVGVVDEDLVEPFDGLCRPGARCGDEKHAAPYTPAMRIGVISDTHGLLRPEVFEAFRGVDHILHSGDIGGEAVLDELGTIAPVTACAGNVDDFRCGPAGETARAEIGGLRFLLVHILDRPQRPRPEVLAELRRAPADVVLFGHSHLPHDERSAGVWYFNPASAGPRRFDYPVSVGIFEKGRGGWKARHVPLDLRSAAALTAHMNQLSRR